MILKHLVFVFPPQPSTNKSFFFLNHFQVFSKLLAFDFTEKTFSPRISLPFKYQDEDLHERLSTQKGRKTFLICLKKL